MPGNVFNLGQAATAGQNFKARQMGIEQNQNIIANRKKALEVRQTYDAMPEQIEQMEAQGLFDEASKLRDHYIQTKKTGVETMENVGRMVQPEDYQKFRSDLIQAGAIDPELMPVKYAKNWWKPESEKQKGKLGQLTRKWGQQGSVMSQDLVTQDGQILWEGSPYKGKQRGDGKKGSGKPWQTTAGDSNSIRGATAQLYGALWDPTTGKYSGLNRDQEKEVAAINEEASKIYNANQGRVPHAEAVARAARKKGIQIQNLTDDPNNQDPLGLR